ncbi:MAG: DUF3854 domain-containing protein [bacterium]
MHWRNVSSSHPCAICERPDWCAYSDDGRWAICRREARPDGIHKLDKNGSDLWVYDLDPRAGHVPYPVIDADILKPNGKQSARRADPDLLNRVYRNLLQALTLTDAHREDLHRRGLSDDEIFRRGYKSWPERGRSKICEPLRGKYGSDLLRVPGFYQKKDEAKGSEWISLTGYAGLCIPVRDPQKRIIALRVRLDDPEQIKKGGKYRWVSSTHHDGTGPGAPIHIPGWDGDPHGLPVIRVTEGELKADIATALSKILTLSIPGAGNWEPILPLLKELQPAAVRLAYDADAPKNRYVASALHDLAQTLIHNGIAVELEIWDPALGKGIDDVLAAGGILTVLSGNEAMDKIIAIYEDAKCADPPPHERVLAAARERIGDLTTRLDDPQFLADEDNIQALAVIRRYAASQWLLEIKKILMKHGIFREVNGMIDEYEKKVAAAAREQRRSADSGGDHDPLSMEAEEKKKEADELIQLAGADEFFHDENLHAYVTFKINDHRETHKITSTKYKDILMCRYSETYKKVPHAEAMTNAITLLGAQARIKKPLDSIHLRIAGIDNKLYIDLGGAAWDCIEVTSAGWTVLKDPPVRFIRKPEMLPLPYPAQGPAGALRPFINTKNKGDYLLILAWLIACLHPTGPYPALILYGPQGSAKSTTARFIRALVDPDKDSLRAAPREELDLAIAASKNWVISFDNLSFIPHWLSDVFCRLSTGGSFGKRTLYSDGEESIFRFKRPLILNSIVDIVDKADLLDRCFTVNLDPILEESRQDEKTLWHKFEKNRPFIIAEILNGVSSALRNIDRVRLDRVPRMADAALWIAAAAEGLGIPVEDFLNAYAQNRADAIDLNLQNDPLATALIAFMKFHGEEWNGTATELLIELENPVLEFVSEKIKKTKLWPGAPHILSRQLKRLESSLREKGIEIIRKRDKGEIRKIFIFFYSRGEGMKSSVGGDGSVGNTYQLTKNQRLNEPTLLTESSDATNASGISNNPATPLASGIQVFKNQDVIDIPDATDTTDATLHTLMECEKNEKDPSTGTEEEF